MLVVGLTGGIGSGKTTVAALFAKKNVPIIDADVVAHKVTEPGMPALDAIIKHIGTFILMPNGELDRSKLRNIIFANPHQRIWLENLLHPLIRKEMQLEIEALTSPYCIAVIPLLFEVEFYSFINRILVVDAVEEDQIARAMQRDKTSRDDVLAILKTQASRHDRVARAHDVIINDGQLEDLVPQVDKLHAKYLELGKEMR